MAHDLSIRKDGTVEMAYTGELPWHGLGVSVAGAMTSQEALQAASLDWDVLSRPVYHPLEDGKMEKVKGYHALLRGDSGAVLHVAKTSYVPLQNREAFQFADRILDSGDAKFVTVGALSGGRRIWLLAELQKCNVMVAGDEIKPYFMLYNSHDGSSMVRGILTPVRVVCQNTVSMALDGARAGEGFQLRHTKNVLENADEARRALGLIRKNFDDMTQRLEPLAKKSFTDGELKAYVNEMLPVAQSAGDRAMASAKERRETAVRFAHEGRGNDREGVRGTWWAAYNGMTELIDHSGAWRSDEGRMKDLVFGNRASLKSKALALAEHGVAGKLIT